MASIIRAGDFTSDTSYEPPLVIGFGIDSKTVERPPAAMGRTIVPPGGRNQAHYHAKSDACICVIKGSLRFYLGDPSEEREAQLVFCYPGVPDKEAAETVFVE